MDTTRLRELTTADGPFASIYFDDTHNTEDAAKHRELTWRELREELAEQGASERTLATVERAVLGGEPPVGSSGRAVVATAERVLLDQRLKEPPARPVARVSRMPYLVPLAEHGELPPPHVVVVVDRVGADVTAVDEHGTVIDSRTVEGADSQVHKVPGGGWSHRNIQAHTEEVVKNNIEKAAVHVGVVARRIGATLVVVAGDPQSRKVLLDTLPQAVRDHAREVEPGGRKEGSGNAELDTLIDELLAEATRKRRAEVTERFETALAKPTGLAVQGLEAVTTALREHNVETLLVSDPDDSEVLVGPDPSLLAVQEEELTTAYGVDEVEHARADEALPMAAATVGADVVGVTGEREIIDGFGAILRHD
ncbi:Rv2629 family ribosome hibernation factor [Saccharomonospora glauca]|uniref:Peptide chain release factor 1 (ERF1) n=1 Tax=Saccharomonospora glauca K62 TaxID=928724 RepID=I1CWY1_9PSEU|nr:Vms1/Ankzf1 family peptidyl-tRNA hydrolase [Saccharomonospora glauca]EIE97205.1 peptide chain release factor 1 (eRF1) [Saccharomonospora glauca K62]